MVRNRNLTLSHWGAYELEVEGDDVASVHSYESDTDPSPIGQSFVGSVRHRSRIGQPAVRRGWLERGPHDHGGGRGEEPFVSVSWDEALDLVAAELDRVRKVHGNEAVFGGSYGWASAGRFHHALSQIHRFLNGFGGYTFSVDTYSTAAARVVIPHVLGKDFFYGVVMSMTAWPVIAEHTRLVVAFGGVALKNAQTSAGGLVRHTARDWLQRARDNDVEFVNISPLKEDAAEFLEAEWWPLRPNTDTAMMLGLAHTLVVEDLHDREFLSSHCTGFDRFLPYLMGDKDGIAKTADWAAAITGVDGDRIRALARRMAETRTMIMVARALQRGDHGEQPYWMGAVLAAILGQIGLPGGGVGFGYAAEGGNGSPVQVRRGPALPQGVNRVEKFIPVARIADALLQPGEAYDYNGQRLTFPDIRLVYWCGGNPFHHHQDLNRLVAAWQRPETIVVHEPYWNSLARHADIVLPATTSLERNDIGRSSNDPHIVAMPQVVPPPGEARNDYDMFRALASRLGFEDQFTEGRSEMEWLRHLYDDFRQHVARDDIELPDFGAFWHLNILELPLEDNDRVLLEDFRRNPQEYPLPTPSGRIEIFSETIDRFGYDDCPGHPIWMEPAEWLGSELSQKFPLHLLSNQPRTRLHSQLDFGSTSTDSKIKGREPILIHLDDARSRGIQDGDVVRIFNDRGACLAGARVTSDILPGVVMLCTGAWYDPVTPGGLDRHGNPNVLTLDKGTSRLAQGPSSNTTLVEMERAADPVPAIEVFDPPEIQVRGHDE
ncbi:MAG: Asp-tRNA(Asn)/Glu-tRNA(Gln) amidotransferase GatCAB subunit C [Alphaproteobacteria bacterium]|nr:Asp-tRNA(Asn)/Glu-tRNA(Gln) amidotransferase GatCAB subunit C [Alphaproteobacteria bacterium]